MGPYVALRLIKMLAAHDVPPAGLRVGILGLTFKENVPDIRNSKVVDIVRELRSFGVEPLVHDPFARAEATAEELGVELSPIENLRDLHALVLAVPHAAYNELGANKVSEMIGQSGLFIDVKSRFQPTDLRSDIRYWSL
jgi:UDP-N-acetyl-D-galactosamine dehydrogenase